MIRFDPFHSLYKSPVGAVVVSQEVLLCVELVRDYEAFYPIVLSVQKDEGPWCDYPCSEMGKTEGGVKRIGTVWQAAEPGIYFYRFQALRADGSVADGTPVYQQSVYKNYFTTPEWLRDAVMYQIFPDRFKRSGKTEIPTQNKQWVFRKNWGEDPVSGPDESGVVQNNDFFGGDLKGIEESLPYLADLGVNVIYLNPIFQAYSNHRYDTADYMNVDPLLGSNKDFKQLCRHAKSHGIRIILDGVFNHTGSHSRYFNKDGAFDDIGAYQSQDSVYYNWYMFHAWPKDYASWWGIDTLPSLREENPEVLDFFIRNEESVVAYWLRAGASGFRLDVADELPDEFLDLLRKRVKEINPEACIIGEVWEDASNKIAYGHRRRYFEGDQLDTVMNYPLKDGIIAFLNGKISGRQFAARVHALLDHYPAPAFQTLMNILGTHDTPRIRTVLSEQANEQQTREKLFAALAIWAFMPGCACLYYGDEIGMEGGRDPMNRRCFDYERKDKEIHRHYRLLLAFRKSLKNIGSMELTQIHGEADLFCFLRVNHENELFTAVHTGGGTWKKIFEKPPVSILTSGQASFEDNTLILEGCASAVLYF